MTIKEMLEKRAKHIADARAILDKAETEKREPTAEERQQFDKLMKDAGTLKDDADRLTNLEKQEKELGDSRGRKTTSEVADQQPEKPEVRKIELRKSLSGMDRTISYTHDKDQEARAAAFRKYLRGGPTALVGDEARALQKDTDTTGGYLSAPVQFMAQLIQGLDNLVWMRQISNVLPAVTSADTLGAPSLDTDVADPAWTTELQIGSEDSSLAFGKRELTPHPLAKYVKISKTLLRRSALDAEAIVRSRLEYKNAVAQENAFLNGTGQQQPLGVFTASNDGITTSQDVSTGNTDTAITFDGLKNCFYNLPAQYRRNLAWIFHRDAVLQISKLKDGEGRYIWQNSVVVGDPDRILNVPVYESEYAPNTFTTGQYVGLLGNFQYYWIVDALTMTIQVLTELYAATNQNGYISRLETDGMPVLAAAFRRVKLA